jgi:hypothetical protein
MNWNRVLTEESFSVAKNAGCGCQDEGKIKPPHLKLELLALMNRLHYNLPSQDFIYKAAYSR